MKPRRIVRGERVTAGLVLTRDLAGLPKGRILSDDDVRALESSSWSELEVLELEPSDVHEEVAGQRLAAAVAGEGAEPGPVEGGSFPLIARRRGLLEVEVARLSELNLIPDLAVNTHPPQYVAVEGNVVARAKVIPFVTREDRLRRAEEAALRRAGARPPVRLAARGPLGPREDRRGRAGARAARLPREARLFRVETRFGPGGARQSRRAGAGAARGAAQRGAAPGAGRQPVDGSAGSGPARPRSCGRADGAARGSGVSRDAAVDRVSGRGPGAGRAL